MLESLKSMTHYLKLSLAFIVGIFFGVFIGYLINLAVLNEKWIGVVGAVGGGLVGAFSAGAFTFITKQNEFSFQREKEKRELFTKKAEEIMTCLAGIKLSFLALSNITIDIVYSKQLKEELLSDLRSQYHKQLVLITEKMSQLEALQTLYLREAEGAMVNLDTPIKIFIESSTESISNANDIIPPKYLTNIYTAIDEIREICRKKFEDVLNQ